MASLFNKFFHSTFTPPSDAPMPNINITHDPDLASITLIVPEVIKQLKNLNPSKAQGPDNIPTMVLKACAESLAPSITKLFNASLLTACLPSSWKMANIVPIHKKDSKNQAKNYRPISLLPVISKILERCVYNRLIDYILPKITHLQHGFLRNRSTATQLLSILSNINNILDTGDQCDTVYFDLSKAFDSVPHRLLIHKLKSFGLHGTLLAWIENYLTHRRQRVTINGSNSEWLTVTSGVPQGSILGPLLFLLYINDLPTVLSPNTLCAIFADDTKITRHIQSHQDHLILQRDITNVHKWSMEWGLKFNSTKCMILSMARSGHTLEYNYTMGQAPLTRTKSVNDLGVQVTTSLKWNEHLTKIISKANQRLWITIRTLGFEAPILAKKTTYVALVRPHLEYNTIIWSPTTKELILSLERTQRKATNFILSNPKRPSPQHMEYRERLLTCNLLPLTYRREVFDLIFFIKSLRGMVAFNILDYLSFQVNRGTALTRNMQHGLNILTPITRLESSAHFYPSRIARIWNTLPLELRTKLKSPLSLHHIKIILNKYYQNLLTDIFHTDRVCTWVTICRCNLCRP